MSVELVDKEEALATPSVKVRGWVDPFHPQSTAFGVVMAGSTVADAVNKACRCANVRKRYQKYGICYVGRYQANGSYKWEQVPQNRWNSTYLYHNDTMTFRLLPTGGGGSNPLRMILTLVVMVIAVVMSVWTAGASLSLLGAVGSQVLGGVVGAAVMTCGMMLVNAIAPVKTSSSSLSSADSDDVYTLSASSNSLEKWGYVPILFGEGDYAPKKAAAPYTEIIDNDLYLYELFLWGQCGTGTYHISDLKVNDTDISEYDDLHVYTWRYNKDDSSTWTPKYYPCVVTQSEYSITLRYYVEQTDEEKNNKAPKVVAGATVRTTQENTTKIAIDISFSALVHYDKKGNAENTTVDFAIAYRVNGTSAWTKVEDTKTVAGKTLSGMFSGACVYIYNDALYMSSGCPRNGRLLYRIYGQNIYATSSTGESTVQSEYNTPVGITNARVSKEFDSDVRSGFGYTLVTQSYDVPTVVNGVTTTKTITLVTGIKINSGVYAPLSGKSLSVTAKSTSAVRRTFEITGLSPNTYDVSVQRITDDHDDDDKYQSTCYWTSMRSYAENELPLGHYDYSTGTQRPLPFNCVLTCIKVKATDQLNGSISNFTGHYKTVIPAYDQTNKVWRNKETRDLVPAIRFVLQQATARPQDSSVINWSNLIETDAYWKSLGWKYDKIVDSETSAFSLVQEICAAGLASPTFIDGKWAIIVDKPRTDVVMGITAANSWSWTVSRIASEMPHYIQCDFINEDTWESDEIEVRTDEVLADGQAPIYEKMTFEGVTVYDNVYKQARFHYADAKSQVRTITMTMWDESLIASRGDLVALSQPYLIPTGLQAGRIKTVITNTSGGTTTITGVKTDVTNDLDPSRTLGIKVYTRSGNIVHAKLTVDENSSYHTQTLTFASPITADLDRGDKYVLGDYGEEDFLAVITGMKYNTDLTCEVTCIDYIENKYNILTNPDYVIPEFRSVITKPVTVSHMLTPMPIIREVITDESVALASLANDRMLSGNKVNYTTRAMFIFSTPSNIDSRAMYIAGQYRRHTEGDAEINNAWTSFLTNMPISETQCYCSNVTEGEYYDFRFQYVGASGMTSKWATLEEVLIEGKTAPPQDVNAVTVVKDSSLGFTLNWEGVPDKDLKCYYVAGEFMSSSEKALVLINNIDYNSSDILTTFTTLTSYAKETAQNTYGWITPKTFTGEAKWAVWCMDTSGNYCKHITTASYNVIGPNVPYINIAKLLEGGLFVDIGNTPASTWDIANYTVLCSSTGATPTTVNTTQSFYADVPSLWKPGDTLSVYCTDKFGNVSATSSAYNIVYYIPKLPVIALGYNKTTGNITVDWQDCRYSELDNTPTIKYYIINGTLASRSVSRETLTTTATHYEADVPLTAFEYGTDQLNGILVNVATIDVSIIAVDKYGVTSEYNADYGTSKDTSHKTISVYKPYNPAYFSTSGANNATSESNTDEDTSTGNSITLYWRDCTTTFAIDHYEVVDEYFNTTYKTNTNYVVLPSRAKGDYRITVQAVDVVGQESSAMPYVLNIGGIGNMRVNAQVDGQDILLQWDVPTSTFEIAYYIIKRDNDVIPNLDNINEDDPTLVGKAKTNYYRIPAGTAGDYVFYVWAVDVAGNINNNYINYTDITITAPTVPSITCSYYGDGLRLKWDYTEDPTIGQLPIVRWNVQRYKGDTHATDLSQLGTADSVYGQFDVNTLDVLPVTTDGNKYQAHTFYVQGIDSGGNEGTWGNCVFIVTAPGRVTYTYANAIDTNIQIQWTQPDEIYFPIKEYVVEEVQKGENAGEDLTAEVGHVDSQFVSIQENLGGEHTYRVTPIDTGGNRGTGVDRTIITEIPDDFVFYDQVDSLFNGTLTNMVLDGMGSMIGPVPVGETWQENIERAALMSGKTIDTHSSKVNAGYKTWVEPIGTSMQLIGYDGSIWARLVYQFSGTGGGYFPSKEDAWDYDGADGNLFSQLWILRDRPSMFQDTDGTYEFIMFQSDDTGPFTGDSSVYARWTQTVNPTTTQYEDGDDKTATAEGFVSKAVVGTALPYGLALSTTDNALLDGYPKYSYWSGAVATVKAYKTDKMPVLTLQQYCQLWVRIPDISAFGAAKYVEVCDHLTNVKDKSITISSTKVTYTITSTALYGTPKYTIGLDTGKWVEQEDGTYEIEWTHVTDDATGSANASDFRYTRTTLIITGGIASISAIAIDLNVTKISDMGTVVCNADDNGEGYVSESETPMLTGTWVPFNKQFVDVQYIYQPTIKNNPSLTAYYTFDDVLDPSGFRIFVKDANGNRASATVDWKVDGV